jgi:hypothetical protein
VKRGAYKEYLQRQPMTARSIKGDMILNDHMKLNVTVVAYQEQGARKVKYDEPRVMKMVVAGTNCGATLLVESSTSMAWFLDYDCASMRPVRGLDRRVVAFIAQITERE